MNRHGTGGHTVLRYDSPHAPRAAQPITERMEAP